jgi:hypothetical protein
VRDRDYFYLWSFSAWGVWAGLGLVALWETLAQAIGSQKVRLGAETVDTPLRRSWMLAAPILLLAILPLIFNWRTASRAGETDTRDFAHDLLNSVEPYGVLVTVGDNDTFPLWYAQEVEGIRKDVVVANTSLLNTDWYVRQLVRRPVHEYDAAKGPAIYRGKQWVKPASSPLKMTMAQADSIPQWTSVRQPMIFRKDQLTATIDPRNLMQDGQGGGILQKSDIVVLRILADSWPERPVYFSRTSGGYARELGLGTHVLTQGLASKVFVPPAASGRDTMLVQGDGWVDVARTQALWNEVFEAPKSLANRRDWVDRPSVGIPYLYISTGLLLAETLRANGMEEQAKQTYDRARAIAKSVRLEQIFAQADPFQVQQPQLIPGGDSPGRPVPASP